VSKWDGFSATAKPGPENTEWGSPNNGWKVTLKNARGNSYTVPFYKGIGLPNTPPTAAEVLECLIDDANGYRNARSFEEWAGEYGYDTDSRAAYRTFEACRRVSERLDKFLTPEEFEALAYGDDDDDDTTEG
jgi:hypothetical protein